MIVYDYIWFPLKNLPCSPWSPYYAPQQITQITPGRAHCSAVPQAHDVVLSPQSKHLSISCATEYFKVCSMNTRQYFWLCDMWVKTLVHQDCSPGFFVGCSSHKT